MSSLNSTSPAYIQYHTIAKHWKSDIDFFEIEMVFLHHLLNNHFILLSGPAYIDVLQTVGEKFSQLEKDKNNTDTDLIDYIKVLEGQTENLGDGHGESLAIKHKQMEYSMHHLTSAYRKLKQELFSLVIDLIQDRKLQGLSQE
jgi:hypothetical protein